MTMAMASLPFRFSVPMSAFVDSLMDVKEKIIEKPQTGQCQKGGCLATWYAGSMSIYSLRHPRQSNLSTHEFYDSRGNNVSPLVKRCTHSQCELDWPIENQFVSALVSIPNLSPDSHQCPRSGFPGWSKRWR
jgi:hypothetical protein